MDDAGAESWVEQVQIAVQKEPSDATGLGELKVLAGVLPAVTDAAAWPRLDVPSDFDARLQILSRLGWRDYQLDAIRAVASAPLGRGILELGTGAGKTRLAVGLVWCLSPDTDKWAYVVHGVDLVRQAQSTFDSWLPRLNASIGSSVSCSCMGWAALRRTAGVSGVVCDEVHGVAAAGRAQAMAAFRGHWRIGLSGTPTDRADGKGLQVIGLVGPVLYTVGVRDLQSEGYLAESAVQYV